MVALLLCPVSGCYHYELAPCDPGRLTQGCYPTADPAVEWESLTIGRYLWGARPSDFVPATACRNNTKLDTVVIEENLAFSLIRVATLGFYSPLRIKYTCTAEDTGTSTTRAPR
jgi:hypothetical protein